MNITVHSEFRYATRILKEHLDKTEDMFRRIISNECEYKEKLNLAILEEYNQSMYLVCDTFGKYEETHFYLNKETLNIFVVDKEQSSILSCFKVDFDLSETGTKTMLDVLLSEWENHKNKLVENKNDLENNKQHIKSEIKHKNEEIRQLKDRIKSLEESTHTLKTYSDNIDKEIKTLDYNVKNTLAKIIYSFGYKKEVLIK